MPGFRSALTLNGELYAQVLAPRLASIPHAAARLGDGSDVLGYDTERSTDHGWGIALQIFTDHVDETKAVIDHEMPESFEGWPTRYGWDDVAAQSQISVTPLQGWVSHRLGVDPMGGLSIVDWLIVPQQQLLSVTRGRIYHDPEGELEALRSRLGYFPDELWIWLVGCQWRRIAQVEAFVGRTAEVGDDLGSRLIGGYLVRELMRLAFLLERQYWPYQKWFGTAFAELALAERLGPPLTAVLSADDHQDRQDALVAAYELVAEAHNALAITADVDPTVRPFHSRPFLVIGGDRFADACRAAVTDESLRSLPLLGSVDQFADSTDILSYPERVSRLRAVYGSGAGAHPGG